MSRILYIFNAYVNLNASVASKSAFEAINYHTEEFFFFCPHAGTSMQMSLITLPTPSPNIQGNLPWR